MKRFVSSLSFLAIITLFLVSSVFARSGCCSHHGGVVGCGCGDGTPLSSTCASYYPECNGGGSTQQSTPVYIVPSNTPIPLPTWTPIPTRTPIPTLTPTPRLTNTPFPTKVQPTIKSFIQPEINTKEQNGFIKWIRSLFGWK